MAPHRYRLAIDFGTATTVGVLVWPDGRTVPLVFDESPPLPPEASLKQRIEDGAGPADVEALAAVFHRVAVEAAKLGGGAPEAVVLTHPERWAEDRLDVLAEAARQAGLGPVTFLSEPVAAALHLASLGYRPEPDTCLVVYDFGAGTFEASVVWPRLTGYEVVATSGLPDVGGRQLDAAMIGHAHRLTPHALEPWSRLGQPRTEADQAARQDLWARARAAKEQLSYQDTTEFFVPLVDAQLRVGRPEFESAAAPFVERTVALTVDMLRDMRIPLEAVGGLLLVGGSSRVLMVAAALHRALGVTPTAVARPELAVAEGAARPVMPPPYLPTVEPARGNRLGWAIAAGVTAVAVAVTTVVLIANRDDKPSTVAGSPSTSEEVAMAPCDWKPRTGSGDVQQVGTPPTSVPHTGTKKMTVTTDQGVVTVELDLKGSPCAAASFAHLAGRRYFDNTPCHRVTTEGIYVLQCGDPTGTGGGVPNYGFANEAVPARDLYVRGAVAMAINPNDPASNGSQFFIVYRDSQIDPEYTVIGRVVEGVDVVERVAAAGAQTGTDGPPKLRTTIQTLTVE